MIPNDLEVTPEWSQNDLRMISELFQYDPGMFPEWSQHDGKCCQNHASMMPKWFQKYFKIILRDIQQYPTHIPKSSQMI